jgi:hypothetical protein
MVCVGSVVGAVAWGAKLQANAFFFQHHAPGLYPCQISTLLASAFRFGADFVILYLFEFLFLIICKLMLLGRLAANARESSHAEVTEMIGVRRG